MTFLNSVLWFSCWISGRISFLNPLDLEVCKVNTWYKPGRRSWWSPYITTNLTRNWSKACSNNCLRNFFCDQCSTSSREAAARRRAGRARAQRTMKLCDAYSMTRAWSWADDGKLSQSVSRQSVGQPNSENKSRMCACGSTVIAMLCDLSFVNSLLLLLLILNSHSYTQPTIHHTP